MCEILLSQMKHKVQLQPPNSALCPSFLFSFIDVKVVALQYIVFRNPCIVLRRRGHES